MTVGKPFFEKKALAKKQECGSLFLTEKNKLIESRREA
jgi:hypothetical protein